MPTLATDLPPEAVFGKFAAYAGDWHESRLPEALRARGAYGFRFRRSLNGRFYLGLLGLGTSGFRSSYAVRGVVAPAPGGAVVTFDVGLDRWSRATWVVFASIGTIVVGGAVAFATPETRLPALGLALVLGGAAGLVIMAEHWTSAPIRAALLDVPAQAIARAAPSVGAPPA